MNRLLSQMPELELDEAMTIDALLKDKTDEQVRNFAIIYRSRRRDPMIILVTTLLGFVGFSGIQRFLTNQMGMGILYFFTAGLCLIGTIIDLVNYKSLALEYNRKVAQEAAMFI
ncbi:TM2 domain-containing protein [Parabacteroides sp. FAFU027]|uniref:TM2 domain-containing protein n=1 Tax=Parabacteroides sp. FAFU027 TaxID=2922715 RepID=UPI001FAFA566|nr:TM2 domain-containing protein [Parabacteroides sp. FAFU027]